MQNAALDTVCPYAYDARAPVARKSMLNHAAYALQGMHDRAVAGQDR